jgi:hypothetical protein
MRTSIFHEPDREAIYARSVASMIGRMLDVANGERRARLLDAADVRGLIGKVAPMRPDSWPASIPYTWTCGGTVPPRHHNKEHSYTTLALVARIDGSIRVGIALAGAFLTSPGRAWSTLQPWVETNGNLPPIKWRHWITYNDVVTFDDPEIDAYLARPEIGPDF